MEPDTLICLYQLRSPNCSWCQVQRQVVSDVEKFAPMAKIIHVDIDPAELGKNVSTHIQICGDVNRVLDVFNEK